MTGQNSIGQIVGRLERESKDKCEELDSHEKALVEAYLGFLRHVARTSLGRGWRVWFRSNRWTHWGEGGFGSLSILLPPGELEPPAALPSEIRFLREVSDIQRLGEEITLENLDRITYQPDAWS